VKADLFTGQLRASILTGLARNFHRHQPRDLRPAPMIKTYLTFLIMLLVLTTCARKYSVSVNQNTVYDPRGRMTEVRFPDPGLQACVNMRLQQQQLDSVEEITILTCPGLEIRSLEGIQAVSNLEFLDVTDNRLAYLTGLRTLNNLRSVTASGNPLIDISALFALPALNAATFNNANSIPCAHLDRLAQKPGLNLVRPLQCAE
jgi:Leucine-rich repeat (LRR) protein